MADPSLLVDLRVAQAYRDRGVARYSQALVLALGRERPDLEIACLVDPDGDPPLLLPQLAARCRIVEGPAALGAGGPRVTHFLQACLFDRGKDVRDLFPAGLAAHRPRLGAIVYDLIPWVLSDVYLADPGVRRAYLAVLPALGSLDRLFTISESVRHDTVAIGAVRPDRVTTIYGGLDLDRWPRLAQREQARPASGDGAPGRFVAGGVGDGARVDVALPYWLYVGGDDPRKNLERLLEAFGLLAHDGGPRPRLVVACSLATGRADELGARARAHGLEPGVDVVFTGYVSDETLGDLFAGCTATIFPSLYEGLGLPVLESYAFGRPALASDSSSMREIVPASCRFDPYDPTSIADAVRRFDADPRLAADSLAYGREALAMCAWPRAARVVAEWVADRASARRATAPRARPLLVASSLPPDRSGVAQYTQRSLCAPVSPVVFFAPGSTNAAIEDARRAMARARLEEPSVATPVDVLPIDVLDDVREAGPDAPVLFVLGNSDHHLATLRHLLSRGARPGDAVHLHDVFLGGLLEPYAGDLDALDRLLAESYRHAQVDAWRRAGGVLQGGSGSILGTRVLADRGAVRHFIVNSAAAAERLRRDLGERLAEVRVDVAYLPVLPPPRVRSWAPDTSRLRLAHFGIIGPSKQPEVLRAAFGILAARRPIEVLLAGYGVNESARAFGFVGDDVRLLDSPSDPDLQGAMASIDVAVQLRYPEHGESSGVVNQLMALRTPVVCTRTGSFAELEGVAYLVPPDVTPADLADAIEAAAASGPPPTAAEYVATHSPRAFERRVRELLGLDPV